MKELTLKLVEWGKEMMEHTRHLREALQKFITKTEITFASNLIDVASQ